ncbi:hypothetical protein [Metabacillus idriensis]|uniref:hypothetical protein n=1 Tax=Metabacillus idriensis TaxID=324768 RepID=UPI00174BCCA0|nr:hypothetical protein [Metabacillus idriensis]
MQSVASIDQDDSLAEDLAQNALVIALENDGVRYSGQPGSLAHDCYRRNNLRDQKYEGIGSNMEFKMKTDYDSIDEEIIDNLLRLIGGVYPRMD